MSVGFQLIEKKFDVVIIGAGILGVCIGYLLSRTFEGKILVLERESAPAVHTSSRNTGVIHRPFYIDPDKKKLSAESTQKSYFLWLELARKFGLPWNPVGTLEIATTEEDVKALDRYGKWATSNGMNPDEFAIMDDVDLRNYDGRLNGYGAILSKTDASVSFGNFTRKIMDLALEEGIQFIPDFTVKRIDEDGSTVNIAGVLGGESIQITADFLFNVAGGESLRLAHQLGLARKYAVLHFRGDYWTLGDSFKIAIRHNLYSVPRHKKFPFLDPHLIIRHDGSMEIGPNAALVSGPYAYGKHVSGLSLAGKIFERPVYPKFKLISNPEFISLVRSEWKSSHSKEHMATRVRQFLPSLEDTHLGGRGISGIRNSLVDNNGFVAEAVIEKGQNSIHILNYNSPGATGAPAFAAYVIKLASSSGFMNLDKRKADSDHGVWAGLSVD